ASQRLVLGEFLDQSAGRFGVILVEQDHAHLAARPAPAGNRAEKQAEHEREREDPEQAELVAPEQAQVFQGQRQDSSEHQSRKLLPVRLRNPVSRLGRSTRNVTKRKPSPCNRAASSKGRSLVKCSTRPSRRPGSGRSAGGSRSSSASTTDCPPC